jgi:hypothetical protein
MARQPDSLLLRFALVLALAAIVLAIMTSVSPHMILRAPRLNQSRRRK